MTQDEFKLFTGVETDMGDDLWETLLAVAEMRLASFLCLDELPLESEATEYAEDLQLLLANFIYAMWKGLGAGEERISSKSVRNFTISFQSKEADGIFAKVASNYADIIAKYSACDPALVVERDWSPYDDRF